jgi:hypothetical protein
MVAIKEIKSTIAVAIAAAFGFIIALIWKDIIIGIMTLAGLWLATGPTTWVDAAISIVVAVIITIVSVIGIVYISKWGGVGQN